MASGLLIIQVSGFYPAEIKKDVDQCEKKERVTAKFVHLKRERAVLREFKGDDGAELDDECGAEKGVDDLQY